MKTSVSTILKTKASEAKKNLKSGKVSSVRNEPAEEQIREEAADIDNQRIDQGDDGTPLEAWLKAEAYLRDLDSI